MTRRKMLAVLIGPMSLAGVVGSVGAYPVTWEFAGEVTFMHDGNDFLGGAVAVGGPFSGLYTFESATPDSSPGDTTRGTYNSAVTTVMGQVGDLTFLGPIGSFGYISVLDNYPNSGDSYGVETLVELLGETVNLSLVLVDAGATVFTSDTLPVSPPNLGALEVARFHMFSEADPFPFSLGGQLTLLVPEPGTLVLLAVGATILATRRRAALVRGDEA